MTSQSENTSPPPESGSVPMIPAGPESKIALALSWILPGAGQLYLGYMRRALGFFLLVNGLFCLGMLLSGGAPVELGRFHWFSHRVPLVGALAVIPETLAFVPTIIAYGLVETGYAYNPIDPQMGFLVHLGYVLSGTAGVLAAFSIADAHHLGRVGKLIRSDQKSSILAAGLTWFVPGLGHWYLGQRSKGVIVFAAVGSLFLLGLSCAGFACVKRGENYFYWAGQILCGLMTIVTSLVTADWSVSEFLPKADLGLLLTTSAGLLNVLLIINAYTTSERMAGREPDPRELARRAEADAGREEDAGRSAT